MHCSSCSHSLLAASTFLCLFHEVKFSEGVYAKGYDTDVFPTFDKS